MTVTAVNAEVDKKSTEVNANFVEAEVSSLPITRNYSGLLSLIPGAVRTRVGTGQVAVGGGTRAGQQVHDRRCEHHESGIRRLGVETNELDIADFNVKRAGITAEFGRTSGALVNAVTKSGTNEITGAVRVEALPDLLRRPATGPDGHPAGHDTYTGAGEPRLPDPEGHALRLRLGRAT